MMTGPNSLDMAAQAMADGWYLTEAFDEQERPLWSMRGRDGLVPLDAYRTKSECREAA